MIDPSDPRHDSEPGLSPTGEAQPPLDDTFRQLRKIGLLGGRIKFYDPEGTDENWISADDAPYLTDSR